MSAFNPFAQLLGIVPTQPPTTGSHTLVVAGRKISDQRQIVHALGLKATSCAIDELDEHDLAELEELKAAKLRADEAAAYQRDRQDPAKMDKRRAWDETHKEDRKRYVAEWKKRNPGRQAELAKAWAKKNYHRNPELMKAKSRAWYAANREKVLAGLKAKRDAAKAEKAAAKVQGVQS